MTTIPTDILEQDELTILLSEALQRSTMSNIFCAVQTLPRDRQRLYAALMALETSIKSVAVLLDKLNDGSEPDNINGASTREVLAWVTKRLLPKPKFIGIDPASGPDQTVYVLRDRAMWMSRRTADQFALAGITNLESLVAVGTEPRTLLQDMMDDITRLIEEDEPS